MDPFALLVNLFGSCTEITKNGLGYGQSHFPFAREHSLRPGLAQGGEFTHIGCTGEDPDSRVQLPCQPDDLCAGMDTGGAENKAASAVYPGAL